MHTKKINIKNQVHYHYENLMKLKILETSNIFIDQKSYKDFVIYFTRYHTDKSITMLNMYYDELKGSLKSMKEKKYLMVDNYAPDKVLDKIKRIGIEKLDSIKILIDTDDKLPDDITFKNAMILMTCIIKDSDKFYPQLL